MADCFRDVKFITEVFEFLIFCENVIDRHKNSACIKCWRFIWLSRNCVLCQLKYNFTVVQRFLNFFFRVLFIFITNRPRTTNHYKYNCSKYLFIRIESTVSKKLWCKFLEYLLFTFTKITKSIKEMKFHCWS